MDLSFTPEQEAFRADVRRWIHEAMPPHLKAKAEVDAGFEHAEVMEWHKILFEKGWVAPHWPEEVGGSGLDTTQRFILSEELQASGAPGLSPFGLVMVGPLIIQFGNDAQKARFLPKILAGEEVWCQGYSEPNSGSDLASLRTSAVEDGDHFVVNGQKTWTTYAQYADWIFCLVRTDANGEEAGRHQLPPHRHEERRGRPPNRCSPAGIPPRSADTYFDNVKRAEGEHRRPGQPGLDDGQGAARTRAHPHRRASASLRPMPFTG